MILKKQKEIDMGMQFKLGQAENENSDELLDIYSNDSFIHLLKIKLCLLWNNGSRNKQHFEGKKVTANV